MQNIWFKLLFKILDRLNETYKVQLVNRQQKVADLGNFIESVYYRKLIFQV
jgi:hypothetical protein